MTDASKAAVVATAAYVFADGDPRRLIDVQWATDHLRSLGVVTVSRADYLSLLKDAVDLDAARPSAPSCLAFLSLSRQCGPGMPRGHRPRAPRPR